MNLVLIGMPACGKSTIGVILAKTIGYRFLDTDLVIQELYKTTLEKLIEKQGLEGFLLTEEQAVKTIQTNQCVIATGGSVVYREASMQHLHQNATIIYLKVGYEEIVSRIQNIKSRGVVIREGQTLQELYQERESLYLKYADVVLDVNGLSMEQIVEVIMKECKNEKI